MKYIKLGHTGKQAIVDDDDFEVLNQYKWYIGKRINDYPLRTEYKGFENNKVQAISISMHRHIMNAEKGTCIDHINGNRLDNRKENLRLATSQQNQFNKRKTSKTSIYKGVSFKKDDRNWQVSICKDKKRISLGQFKRERHAAMVYDIWAKDLFGEFARLNFKAVGERSESAANEG